MCQCGPTATGTPNTAGSSTEWSPARWYPPPTTATSASAYRSARIPTRSTTITGAEDVCSTCDSRTGRGRPTDRKSTRLNSSHPSISYAVFCLKKKKNHENDDDMKQSHHLSPPAICLSYFQDAVSVPPP